MRSDDPEYLALVAEFTELDDPDVILAKELYAHFGLLFYVFGLAEHSLINVVLVARLFEGLRSGKIVTGDEWSKEWDRQDPRVTALTFGKLAAEATTLPELADLAADIARAKRDRDYFAHRFFRENSSIWLTEDGTRLLLVRLNGTRKRIKALEEAIEVRLTKMKRRMRLPDTTGARYEEVIQELASEAQSAIHGKKVGWE